MCMRRAWGGGLGLPGVVRRSMVLAIVARTWLNRVVMRDEEHGLGELRNLLRLGDMRHGSSRCRGPSHYRASLQSSVAIDSFQDTFVLMSTLPLADVFLSACLWPSFHCLKDLRRPRSSPPPLAFTPKDIRTASVQIIVHLVHPDCVRRSFSSLALCIFTLIGEVIHVLACIPACFSRWIMPVAAVMSVQRKLDSVGTSDGTSDPKCLNDRRANSTNVFRGCAKFDLS